IDVITSAKRTPLLRSLLAAALLATVAALPTISRTRTTAFRAAATAAPPTDTGAPVSGSAAFAEPLVFAIHPTRPALGLTFEQAFGLVSGRITSWSGIDGRIRPLRLVLGPAAAARVAGIWLLVRRGDAPVRGPRVRELRGNDLP